MKQFLILLALVALPFMAMHIAGTQFPATPGLLWDGFGVLMSGVGAALAVDQIRQQPPQAA